MLGRYIPCFIVPQGICISPDVRFPGVTLAVSRRERSTRESMFFWNFGGGHGLLEYYELTHDEALKEALIKMADCGLEHGWSTTCPG